MGGTSSSQAAEEEKPAAEAQATPQTEEEKAATAAEEPASGAAAADDAAAAGGPSTLPKRLARGKNIQVGLTEPLQPGKVQGLVPSTDVAALSQDLMKVLTQLRQLASKDDCTELRQVFDDADTDKNGSLSADEIEAALAKAGLPMKKDMGKRLLQKFDMDFDKEVPIDELINVIKEKGGKQFDKVTRLVVRQLSKDVTPGQLRAVFEPVTHVISAQVRTNKDGGSRGFGFVVIPDENVTKTIEALNGTEVNGSKMEVQKSERQAKGPEEKEGQASAPVESKTSKNDGSKAEKAKAGKAAGRSEKGKGKGDSGGKGKGKGSTSMPGQGDATRMQQTMPAAAYTMQQQYGYQQPAQHMQYQQMPPSMSPMGQQQQVMRPQMMQVVGPTGQPMQMAAMQQAAMMAASAQMAQQQMQMQQMQQAQQMQQMMYIQQQQQAAQQAQAAAHMQQQQQAPQAAPPPSKSRVFEGSLKSLSTNHGYGFIACKEVRDMHNRDVYIEKGQLPDGARVADRIRFTVELSAKGHPRAANVQLIPMGGGGAR
eukprot:TRINITY_DN14235_c2_g1_i1.p1 TRINITY_DN14235_c2_g1~~TRINITY_DN14235_c2_g1_i1.p1  ORF type:complete len:539 (-),score=196.48 TRINITY_DN14235_c2_g1_i1:240-1856(-)